MARDIAQKFNHRFGEVFKIPEAQIREDVAVVPGIDGEKMSKSYDNTIEIFGDSAGKTRKRIMSVVTDSKQLEDPKDPDTCNVFALYKLFANEAQVQEMRDNYAAGGYGYGHAKKALAELFEAHFAPMRAKREELQNNLDYVEEVLRKGAERAREETGKVMGAAREAKGLA
jgi:tryptophanyl-tRNA synthetase